jgi:hypothetical protein
VRIAAAQQLPALARELGATAAVSQVLPELKELLEDDEVQVRCSASCACGTAAGADTACALHGVACALHSLHMKCDDVVLQQYCLVGSCLRSSQADLRQICSSECAQSEVHQQQRTTFCPSHG